MAVALIIVSVQIWLTYRLFLYRKHGLDFQPQQRRSKVIDISFISLLLAQILVGTQVRTAGEKLQELYPLLSGTEIAGRLGNVNYLHIVLAISLVIFSGILIVRLRGESKLRISLGNSIFLLSITQVLAGFVLILLGIPALVQVFHLWIASILWGLTFVLFTDIKMG
jgi:heme A synthase